MRIDLPELPAWVVMVAALLLLLLIVVQNARLQRAQKRRQATVRTASSGDPESLAAVARLDEAGLLAEQGRLREAVRALYVGTLAALLVARKARDKHVEPGPRWSIPMAGPLLGMSIVPMRTPGRLSRPR